MPRAGLSPARVLELALGVLDDDGWQGMTLAAVAARAGVAVPSLYKHVNGLPELRRRVATVCVAEFDAVLRAAGGTASGGPADPVGPLDPAEPVDTAGPMDPAEPVRRLAAAARAYGVAHPGRYTAVQGGDWARGPEAAELEAASSAPVATIAASMAGLGLPDDRVIDAIRAVRALVHGFVTLQASGGFGLPDDVEVSFTRAIDALVAGLRA